MGKNKKTIKIDILNKFREMENESGSMLPKNWLQEDYFTRLTASERKVFNRAVVELASAGLIEYIPGVFPLVKLTPKGENLIFS